MIFVYIVCKDKNEAKRIGLELVEKKLAGCCNIFPIEAIYRWKGRIVQSKETVLIAKSLNKNFGIIKKEVEKLHSYTTPCILEIPIKNVNSKYLDWLKAEARGKKISLRMFK